MKTKKVNIAAVLAALIIGIGTLISGGTANAAVTSKDAAVSGQQRAYNTSRIGKQVRKKLVSLPYYGVFDNLAYRIDGGTVTLYGQVVRPSTKTDAGRSVARVEGVSRVVNNIEVLPLSSFDDSLRVRTLRALQRTGGLHRYFMGANPSLHIVVNRGHITLAGVVGSNMDRQLAYMTARQISGAFSVTNDLRLYGEDEGIGR